MRILPRRLTLAVGVLVMLAGIAQFFVLRWIDQQEIPITSGARNTLRFVTAVYPMLPGMCGDRCVMRTIKLAHLVALSKYGKKTPADLAKDLGMGYSLLNTTLVKGDLPDQTAEFEIALERLLFFNRMNALAKNWGGDLEGNSDLEKVLLLERYAYDEETKSVSRRETDLFRILKNIKVDSGINRSDFPSAQTSFQEAYQFLVTGFALCSVGEGKGTDYVKQALPFFKNKRMGLIHATTRNLDAPLIAAAEKQAACRDNIYEFKTLLGE